MEVLWVEAGLRAVLECLEEGRDPPEFTLPHGLVAALQGWQEPRPGAPGSPEQVAAVRLKRRLGSIPAPPRFAKALVQAHQRLGRFLRALDLGDPAVRARFLARREDLEDLDVDMRKAHREAGDPEKQPLVLMPAGLYEEVLGVEHTRPEDGEHWPLDRPEGPITWDPE
jgi:hypothetical protein